MKIVVVGVAAESGGALTILENVYAQAAGDESHQWTFFVSRPELEEVRHIDVERHPWVKHSWGHRFFFDHIVLSRRLRQINPDVVLSLHNTPVVAKGVRQVVYLHQALPFSDYRPSLRNEPFLWLYGHLTRIRIRRGLKRPADVVVQADWMNDVVSATRPSGIGRVVTIRPTRPAVERECSAARQVNVPHQFFYPASAFGYKNHRILLDAVRFLVSLTDAPFTLTLTVTRRELEALGLRDIPNNVRMLGILPRCGVAERYHGATLVFPSLVETVGLPLMEARVAGARIVAADLPYAREVLASYGEASFASPYSAVDFAHRMLATMLMPPLRAGSPAPLLEIGPDPWKSLADFLTTQD